MAAADGFRLSVRNADLSEPVTGEVNIIVPARALNELARTVADQPGPVEITVTPTRNQALFRAGNIDFVSRLIDGDSRLPPDHPEGVRHPHGDGHPGVPERDQARLLFCP